MASLVCVIFAKSQRVEKQREGKRGKKKKKAYWERASSLKMANQNFGDGNAGGNGGGEGEGRKGAEEIGKGKRKRKGYG